MILLREPVRAYIYSVVVAVLGALAAFGVLDDPARLGAILGAAAAVLAVGEGVRQTVTPTSNPSTGTEPLVPISAAGSAVVSIAPAEGPPSLSVTPPAVEALSRPLVRTELLPRTDPRLGRHVEHDERSRNFPAPGGKLTSVNHRHYGRVLDQGQLASCTGNAMVDCLMTGPLRVKGRILHEADAVKVYELATTLDSIPGAYPPSDTGSSGLAAAKACVKLGLASSYSHAFGLDACLAALVLSPVAIGVPWYESMFTPDSTGTLHVAGKVAGGHEVTLIGLDAKRERVRVLNSWGASWGEHGRAWLSFADLGRLLSESGDVTVLHA